MSRDLVTAAAIAQVLHGVRLPLGRELAMQNAVSQALSVMGVAHEREYQLGPAHGRIDFFVPESGIGIELKVQGSPSDVTAQLFRYALSHQVRELVLVSGRVQLRNLPPTLHSKPLTVVSTWRSGL